MKQFKLISAEPFLFLFCFFLEIFVDIPGGKSNLQFSLLQYFPWDSGNSTSIPEAVFMNLLVEAYSCETTISAVGLETRRRYS